MITRSQLAMVLSRLEGFSSPDPHQEQYTTDSEIAATVLWNAFMLGDVKDKIIADLGCGTGTLGIGSVLLGAKWVFFVELDQRTLAVARKNWESVREDFGLGNNVTFIGGDVASFEKEVETVIENPPFGVQNEHADRVFLEKAFAISRIVYSMHKIESKAFLEGLAKDRGFKVTHLFNFSFPLKQTMSHHTHRIRRIGVGCWRFAKVSIS